MPGKTAAPHEIPYPLNADKPPSLEAAVKPLSERVHDRLDNIDTSQLVVPGGTGDDGKLAIVKDGAIVLALMNGDATIDENGNLQLGSKVVGTNELGDKAVTSAKLDEDSVTGPKIVPGAVGASEVADGSLTDTELASPNNSAYRTLVCGDGFYPAEANSILYFNSVAELWIAEVSKGPVLFYFAKADYEVSGKAQRLRIRAQLETNGVALANSFTLGMYPVVSTSGGIFTTGTVVTGSTVTFTTPAKNTLSQGNSGDFTIPSDGLYIFGVEPSATPPATAQSAVHFQLQSHNI